MTRNCESMSYSARRKSSNSPRAGNLRLGIDLGGSKIEAAVLDAKGDIVWRARAATSQSDYQATIASICGLLDGARVATGFDGAVGVGIPAIFNASTGKLEGASLGYLNQKPLQHDLAQASGRDIRLANDANCFVLSEAKDGAGAGLEVVVGVILGTGVGCGVMVADKGIVAGRHGIAGEIGHTPLPWLTAEEFALTNDDSQNAAKCRCGKRGCVEAFISGPAVSRDYFHTTGRRLSVEAIAKQFETAGDPKADEVLGRLENRLGRSLAVIINLLDPDAIVLGGGLSNLSRLYQAVPHHWQPYVYKQGRLKTRLLPPKYGDASGVRGAAWLWDDDG